MQTCTLYRCKDNRYLAIADGARDFVIPYGTPCFNGERVSSAVAHSVLHKFGGYLFSPHGMTVLP